MRIVAFLQNQWFKDPEGVKAIFDEHPERRQRYIAHFLFMGCKTGRVLRRALGEELCEQIVWEETSTNIGGNSSSKFPPDYKHIEEIIRKFRPDIILTFGSIANVAIVNVLTFHIGWSLGYTCKILQASHPASRRDISSVYRLAEDLKELMKNANEQTTISTTT